MAKRLFLLTIISLIEVILAPYALMAADSFEIKEPAFNAVETIEKHVDEDEIQESEEDTVEMLSTSGNTVEAAANVSDSPEVNLATAPVVVAEPVYVAPANSISIAGRTLEIVQVGSTAVDSGDHVNKYGDRFLYGHNSAGVFGGLASMGIGSVFTVSQNGVVINYRVMDVVIYEKNMSNGLLQINGTGNYMRPVANARSNGVQYDLSVMTCYGTMYGGGDASHRLVIFANAF